MCTSRILIAFLALFGVTERGLAGQGTNLTLIPGFGFPGSKGNSVFIVLENDQDISRFEIHLHWSPNTLSICDEDSFDCPQCGSCCVCREPPILYWGTFVYDSPAVDDSLIVAGFTESRLTESGPRPIINVKFDVAMTAAFGKYDINLGNIRMFTPLGTEIPCSSTDGEFCVIRRGDVNNDGNVNVLDAILVVRIILGGYQPTPGELSMADCLDDSQIDVQDVLCIVQVILGF